MKNFVKTLGTFIVAGAATTAGVWLWKNVLEEKADNMVDKIKNKGGSKD